MATMTSLSFQPWTRNAAEETALTKVLARVNLERGHFRDITEASLQEEIASEGALELSESEDEGEEEDEAVGMSKSAGKPTTREELYKVKYEMLQHVAAAEQDILMSLDFVSLLLSKQAPQANTTISQVLKEKVPSGTLGTDIWQRMPVDKARDAQDELLATSVRMEGLQRSADSLLSAANRLQDNVRKETQYWSQILSISEKGWNVCRLPGQHRLAVRFGFSESAPEFSRRGIVALNTDSDGNITLEHGIGSRPKAVQVVVQKDGETIGTSQLPDHGKSTLESRIRHARDSLFDEELYHEMIRESRSIASLGIDVKGSAICFRPDVCDSDDALEFMFKLVSLDEIEAHSSHDTQAEDTLAQGIAIAARLLLTQAHRDRLRQRSQVPPPMSDKKEEQPLLPILRPVMSFILHRNAISQLNNYHGTVAKALSAAKIDSTSTKASFDLSSVADITSSETLTSRLMQPWMSTVEINVSDMETGSFTLSLRVDTTLSYNFSSVFTLTAPDVRTVRFITFGELVAGADTILASCMAKALATKSDGQWRCNVRGALLRKTKGDNSNLQSVWVSFDSSTGTLSLNSPTERMTWSAQGGEVGAKSFRSACGDMLR